MIFFNFMFGLETVPGQSTFQYLDWVAATYHFKVLWIFWMISFNLNSLYVIKLFGLVLLSQEWKTLKPT